MEKTQLAKLRVDFLKNLLAEGKRADGRKFDFFRKLDLQIEPVPRANGSCWVKLGNTQVIAGVKVQVDVPYPDTGHRGNFMTAAEMRPIASPAFEPGPPRIESIELARVTDRALRESGLVDLEALCIVPNERVWGVFVDIHVLDYDGNLFDAALIAATAAMLGAKLPAVCPKTGYEASKEDQPMPLRLENAPLSATFVKIGKDILVDPSLEEELCADTRVTIAVDTNGAVRSTQKGGVGSWSVEEIFELRRKTAAHHKRILNQIDRAIKGEPAPKRNNRRRGGKKADAPVQEQAKPEPQKTEVKAEAKPANKRGGRKQPAKKQDVKVEEAKPAQKRGGRQSNRKPEAKPEAEAAEAKPAQKKQQAKKAPARKPAAKKAAPKVDYSKMTVAELKDLAKKNKVTLASRAKKADIIAALQA